MGLIYRESLVDTFASVHVQVKVSYVLFGRERERKSEGKVKEEAGD